MDRIYYQYEEWEDFQNGMYRIPNIEDEKLINKSIELLSNCDLFLETAKNMTYDWPISTHVNLSNTSCNRYAWIGQASCCYLYGSPELITRQSWGLLNDMQKNKANLVAEKIIISYETKDKGLHKNMGTKMLF
jgi:hypothetical protein